MGGLGGNIYTRNFWDNFILKHEVLPEISLNPTEEDLTFYQVCWIFGFVDIPIWPNWAIRLYFLDPLGFNFSDETSSKLKSQKPKGFCSKSPTK